MLSGEVVRRLIGIVRSDGQDAVARRNAAQILWLRFPDVPEEHVREALTAIADAVTNGPGPGRAFPYEED